MKSASALLLVVVFVSVFVFPRSVVAQPPAAAETEAVWSCSIHAVVAEKAAGKCPICRRDLVPVTATVSWTCADRPEIDRPAPGKCPDGSAMEKRYVQSTHANHNPQHGGLFFPFTTRRQLFASPHSPTQANQYRSTSTSRAPE